MRIETTKSHVVVHGDDPTNYHETGRLLKSTVVDLLQAGPGDKPIILGDYRSIHSGHPWNTTNLGGEIFRNGCIRIGCTMIPAAEVKKVRDRFIVEGLL